MKILLRLITFTLLFTLLANCEVTFDEDMLEFIDDVASRSPLEFTLSDSMAIDGIDSINLGYHIEDYTGSYTITNTDKVAIHLTAFEGISGSFYIAPMEASVIEVGEELTFDLYFNFSPDNAFSRISSEVTLSDEDGREYTFFIWVTSKPQPLSIYDTELNTIDSIDMGTKDNRVLTIINEGLETVNISDIYTTTSAISIDGNNSFSLSINEQRDITLFYNNKDIIVENETLFFETDATIEPNLTISIYAGNSLSLDVYDSSGSNILWYDFWVYSSNETNTQTFSIINDSLWNMDITTSLDSTNFLTDIVPIFLDKGDTTTFSVTFVPSGDTDFVEDSLFFYDSISGRSVEFNLKGHYSP